MPPKRKQGSVTFEEVGWAEEEKPSESILGQDPSSDSDKENQPPEGFDFHFKKSRPSPSCFYYPDLSLRDKAYIYKELLDYCAVSGFRLGSCRGFVKPWLALAERAIIVLNELFSHSPS